MSARQIIVTLGGAEGVAELFDDLAPKTCAAIRAARPLAGTVNHANFSGEEVSFPTRGLLRDREHRLFEYVPGDLHLLRRSGPREESFYRQLGATLDSQ